MAVEVASVRATYVYVWGSADQSLAGNHTGIRVFLTVSDGGKNPLSGEYNPSLLDVFL